MTNTNSLGNGMRFRFAPRSMTLNGLKTAVGPKF